MNYKIEQKWIDYWSNLYELIDTLKNPKILDENYQVITVEEAQALIQGTVYDGYSIEFKIEFYKGERAIVITLNGNKTWKK